MPDRSRHAARRAQSPSAHDALVTRAVLAMMAGTALTACGPDPVAWDDAQERRLPPPPISAATGAPDAAADQLVEHTVDSLTVPTQARPSGARAVLTTVESTTVAPPPDPAGTRCPTSLRMAAAQGGRPGSNLVAVWWAQRRDGSAALVMSRTRDGGRTWSASAPVDTVDRSEAGCDRPAPSVAVDSANGYLHVAYSMRAPEGPGVFYAHQMDPRGPFERPQVIVYGDRPAATSVTSAGDRVVVAYEDPNTGGRPFVSLALSRTAGHSWAERVPVSASNVAAERPVVALRGRDQVVLGWVERSAPRELTSTDDPRAAVAPLPSGVVVRVGRLHD